MNFKTIVFSALLITSAWASNTLAAPLELPYGVSLSCGANHVGAGYFKWAGEMVGNLQNQYNTTQHEAPNGKATFMTCTGEARNFSCDGTWAFDDKPAHVNFKLTWNNQYVATFSLPSRPEPISVSCKLVRQ